MLKTMIVDDSLLARKLLRGLLEKMGLEIAAEADSGEKALIKYQSILPDLVLMDVVMPGIGGIEAAKKILGQYPDAKIIITSSHMQNDLKAELLKNGLNFLIPKPIKETDLSDAIQRIQSNAGTNIRVDREKEEKRRAELRSYLENLAKNKKESNSRTSGEFHKGMAVGVGYGFSLQPLSSHVAGVNGDRLLLKFDSKLEQYSFDREDPVILCYLSGNEFKLCNASIAETEPKEKSIGVLLESPVLLNDETLDENFPACLQIDFKSEFSAKKQAALIRNFGPYQCRIVAKTEMNVGEKLNFNINLEEKVISMSAEVVSKKQGVYTFEYDLKTTYIDLNSKRLVKLFIVQLREEYKRAVSTVSDIGY